MTLQRLADDRAHVLVPPPRDDAADSADEHVDRIERSVRRTADAVLKWSALAERYERRTAGELTPAARTRLERLEAACVLGRRSLQALLGGASSRPAPDAT